MLILGEISHPPPLYRNTGVKPDWIASEAGAIRYPLAMTYKYFPLVNSTIQ